MKRLRFSLLSLLGVVALFVAACTAVRSPSEIWDRATIACAGGLLARHFYDRRPQPKQEESAGT